MKIMCKNVFSITYLHNKATSPSYYMLRKVIYNDRDFHMIVNNIKIILLTKAKKRVIYVYQVFVSFYNL